VTNLVSPQQTVLCIPVGPAKTIVLTISCKAISRGYCICCHLFDGSNHRRCCSCCFSACATFADEDSGHCCERCFGLKYGPVSLAESVCNVLINAATPDRNTFVAAALSHCIQQCANCKLRASDICRGGDVTNAQIITVVSEL